MFIYLISSPLSAQASIFSVLSDVFSVNQADQVQSPKDTNLQKIALLQATVNPDPLAQKNPIDTSIVDGEALAGGNSIFGTASSTSNIGNLPSSDQISAYTIRPGDTLSQIAQMFGVSVNTILFANDLKRGQALTPGQVLVILPISGIQYVVKKGDTVQSIAKKFSGDPSDIAQYNSLDVSSTLTVGDQIIIPDVESAAISGVDSSGSSSSGSSKGNGTGSGRKTKFVSPAGGSLTDPNGYFIRPISGGVRTQGIHGHNAVDLATSYGSPIYAAAEGQVIIAKSGGYNGGYGSYVVIQHPDGMQTLYAHMSRVAASVGESVSQGQTIGYIGTTGNATGPHVHFEVHGGVNPF